MSEYFEPGSLVWVLDVTEISSRRMVGHFGKHETFTRILERPTNFAGTVIKRQEKLDDEWYLVEMIDEPDVKRYWPRERLAARASEWSMYR